MLDRKVCFDTETTGREQGVDRIFEIGCVELIDNVATKNTFYCMIDPEKDIPLEVQQLCGVKNEDVKGKPRFKDVVDDFLAFVKDSPLIAHNAEFDIGFINSELNILGREKIKNEVIDTLTIARHKFPGQKNTLTALCERFNIDDTIREYHGALIDAVLLSKVYLELNGGVEQKLFGSKNTESTNDLTETNIKNFEKLKQEILESKVYESRNFTIDENELKAHNEFINKNFTDKKTGVNNSIWLKENNGNESK